MDFLSPENLTALRLCAQSSVISDKVFNLLVEFSCDSILDPKSTQEIPKELRGSNPSAVKQCHAALMCLLLESAKTDIQDDQLGMILDDCNFSSQRKEYFILIFNRFRSDLRRHLSCIGACLPHIVDVGWRLDYNIKNNHIHKVNELRYTVSLKQDDGESIDFTCTREELQDMVGKFKEAAKAVERASQA